MTTEALSIYGLKPVAHVQIVDGKFIIDATDPEAMRLTESVYAFLIGEEIVRIGSSKGVLRTRFNAWQRDITNAMCGRRSSAPPWEGEFWLSVLPPGVTGTVRVRKGTTITTPAGTFNAYLSEESYLIGHHLPRMNRSKHR